MFIQTEDKSVIRFSCPEFGSTNGNLFKSLGCLFTVGFKQSNEYDTICELYTPKAYPIFSNFPFGNIHDPAMSKRQLESYSLKEIEPDPFAE